MLYVEEMYKYNQLLIHSCLSGRTQLVRYQHMDGYFTDPIEDAALVKECHDDGTIKDQSLYVVRISKLREVAGDC